MEKRPIIANNKVPITDIIPNMPKKVTTLCEVEYDLEHNTFYITRSGFNLVEHDTLHRLLTPEQLAALEQHYFQKFLTTPVISNKKRSKQNPDFGMLTALWHVKNASKKKKSMMDMTIRETGDFEKVPHNIHEAVVKRTYPKINSE
jgi:hypothetical protein